MYLIIGLGNPGNEYFQTRHNIGFFVVDKLAASNGAVFRPGKGNYWFAECSLNNFEAFILKPTTYMNDSGIAVEEFRLDRDIPIKNILVVCDDFQLPFGTIRLRQNGSDGGHNGLSSVIYHLQTDQFARLRCGIASSFMPVEKKYMRDFVLEKFHESEIPLLKVMVKQAEDACMSYVADGIESAMNKFNNIKREDLV